MSAFPKLNLGSETKSEIVEDTPELIQELIQILDFFDFSDQVFLEHWNPRNPSLEIPSKNNFESSSLSHNK